MPATSHEKQIDSLMERASQALVATKYFEAEALASQALVRARQADDFGRMARIIMPLQEARRQRFQLALETDTVVIWDKGPVLETTKVKRGCYLVQPPLVGADARRLRLSGLMDHVPAAVLCREPLTTLKLCPVVTMGPGVTVRTKIDPPADPEAPDLEWFVDAFEALGDFAIETVDPGRPVLKRLDAMLTRLDILPEHEGLHHAVEALCREAEREVAEPATAGKGKTR